MGYTRVHDKGYGGRPHTEQILLPPVKSLPSQGVSVQFLDAPQAAECLHKLSAPPPLPGLLEEEISVTLGTQSTLLEDRLVRKGDFKLSLAG